MSGAWTYISGCGVFFCIVLIVAGCFLWDKLDNNKMIDFIMAKLFIISGCLIIVPFIIAVFIETVCFPRMEWKYNEPDSIERIVALQDNNLSKYKFYGRRTYVNEQLYYQYMVDIGNAYKANQIPANDTTLYYDSDYPRVEWHKRKKSIWIFKHEESYWKMYVPEGTITEDYLVDLQ